MNNNQGNSSGYSEDAGSGSVITEQVKQTGQQAVQQTQQAAGQVAESAKNQATSYAEGQKQAASQGLRTVAQALHQTSSNMGSQMQGPVVNYTNTAGDKVEQFAQYLESTPVQELAHGVENFARRNSTLFLGGAFALGLAAARFLKASSQPSGNTASQYGNSYSGSSSTSALPAPSGYGTGSQYSSSNYSSGTSDYFSGGASTDYTSSGSSSGYGSSAGSTGAVIGETETIVVDEVEYPDATVFDAEGETTHGSSI
jgi:hypothetical protein